MGSLLLGSVVLAKVVSEDSPRVPANQIVDDDLFIAGADIAIEGTVNGDVYAAGNTITISGIVNGDVIAVGQTITVSGSVRDDLRAAAQSIQLTGAKIGDSVSVATQTLTVDGSSIGGGILVAAESASLRSPVGRGIVGALNRLNVDSLVGKDIRVVLDQLTLGAGARVGGEVVYQSGKEARVDEGARLAGGLRRTQPRAEPAFQLGLGYKIWSLLGTVLVGLVLMRLFPRVFEQSRDLINHQPWPIAGWGLLVVLATIPAAIVVAITIIGIPLALLTLLGYFVMFYLAKFFAIYAITNWAWTRYKLKKRSPYMILTVGLLAYYVLLLVPIVGWLLRAAALLLGAGALAVYLIRRPTASGKTTSTPHPPS